MDVETPTKDAVSPEAVGDSADKGQRDSEDPKVYTEKEAEAKFSKQRSVLDTKVTGLEKERDTANQSLIDLRKEQDEAEEAALGPDNADGLAGLRARKKARDQANDLAEGKRKLDEDKEKHQESVKSDLEEVRVYKRTQMASEVAVAKGVSMDSILKLAKDDSREAMETAANELKNAGGAKPLKLDSGRTFGGGNVPESADDQLKEGFRQLLKKK